MPTEKNYWGVIPPPPPPARYGPVDINTTSSASSVTSSAYTLLVCEKYQSIWVLCLGLLPIYTCVLENQDGDHVVNVYLIWIPQRNVWERGGDWEGSEDPGNKYLEVQIGLPSKQSSTLKCNIDWVTFRGQVILSPAAWSLRSSIIPRRSLVHHIQEEKKTLH